MTDKQASTKPDKMQEFRELVDDIELAMFVTRAADGALVSRAMQTQKRRAGVDLWFVTSTETEKVAELEANPEVNVSYLNTGSREWVSVSGMARISQDADLVRQLYQPDWKAWFPDQGGNMDGGPSDPRIVIIEIDAHEVTYFKSTTSRPVALFKVLKAMATGTPPDLGKSQHVEK